MFGNVQDRQGMPERRRQVANSIKQKVDQQRQRQSGRCARGEDYGLFVCIHLRGHDEQ